MLTGESHLQGARLSACAPGPTTVQSCYRKARLSAARGAPFLNWEGCIVVAPVWSPSASKRPGCMMPSRVRTSSVTELPWTTAGSAFRCFYCETITRSPATEPAPDPDRVDPNLRETHRRLWSKSLPGGVPLELAASRWSAYLTVVSPGAGWTLGSDNIATIHYNGLRRLAEAMVPDRHLCQFCTVGGYLVFPNQLAQQQTTRINETARRWGINQARGMERRISDRFDLTFEAIRLFYEGVVHRNENPIGDVLEAYRWWFALFGEGQDGFTAYADFFHLTPLLDEHGRVKPFGFLTLEFDDVLPGDEATYRDYIAAQLKFVAARNDLIRQSV
jgi:hypothetical protein